MKQKFELTKEEREIVSRLDYEKIEKWADNDEFWRIYRVVIKETKEYLKNNNTKVREVKK